MLRGTRVPEGYYLLLVSILTQNSRGEILVTRRAPEKKYAGRWEITGGCVQSGETALQGAVRELREETGIEAGVHEVLHCGTRIRADYIHEFYKVRKDVPLSEIKLQPGETDDAKWVTAAQFREMAERHMTITHQTAFFFDYYPDVFGFTG